MALPSESTRDGQAGYLDRSKACQDMLVQPKPLDRYRACASQRTKPRHRLNTYLTSWQHELETAPLIFVTYCNEAARNKDNEEGIL